MSEKNDASKTRRVKRDPAMRVAAIESELKRVRAREERRLIRAADKAGFFNLSFSRAETEAMFSSCHQGQCCPEALDARRAQGKTGAGALKGLKG